MTIRLITSAIITSLLSVTIPLTGDIANATTIDILPLVEKNPDARVWERSNFGYLRKADYNRYMKAGYEAINSGNYGQALRSFQSAVQKYPGNRFAIAAYNNTLELYSQEELDYDTYMEVGYATADMHAYYFAMMQFQKALEERPNDPYALEAINNIKSYLGLNQ